MARTPWQTQLTVGHPPPLKKKIWIRAYAEFTGVLMLRHIRGMCDVWSDHWVQKNQVYFASWFFKYLIMIPVFTSFNPAMYTYISNRYKHISLYTYVHTQHLIGKECLMREIYKFQVGSCEHLKSVQKSIFTNSTNIPMSRNFGQKIRLLHLVIGGLQLVE